MHADFLIVGQGISGTWLSYYLQKKGKSFIVIDNNYSNAPSRVAAGIINPVTGRRHATVWLANELLPFAWNAYNELGRSLGIRAISQKNIIDFFPSAQMRLSFTERVNEKTNYVSIPADEKRFLDHFNYDLGFGEISPVYTSHLENILPAWRKQLLEKNLLLEEEFVISELERKKKGIQYKNITADKIIFCDGPGCANNPWFEKLPFAPNKGEALTLHIKDLPPANIYKRGLTLAPLSTPGHWWIGSAYEWDFTNADPTEAFRSKAISLLREWLKLPFEVTGHFASLRPATLERRPFVGLHPLQPNICILNGMGTKGCSLAPFFARQLVDHLVHDKQIYPDADVNRFQKILSRNLS
ncbi:MAG: FAD-binding oxidoreductase [Chitinophagaceae bacterium]|nr:FAD-binding oxidoreductase [Chitinophagaceae bacterium]